MVNDRTSHMKTHPEVTSTAHHELNGLLYEYNNSLEQYYHIIRRTREYMYSHLNSCTSSYTTIYQIIFIVNGSNG